MAKYIVFEDCFCEHYIHEKTKYPREGLVELKLFKDDIVEHIMKWSNMYGTYIRVTKDNNNYDIPPHKLKLL